MFVFLSLNCKCLIVSVKITYKKLIGKKKNSAID